MSNHLQISRYFYNVHISRFILSLFSVESTPVNCPTTRNNLSAFSLDHSINYYRSERFSNDNETPRCNRDASAEKFIEPRRARQIERLTTCTFRASYVSSSRVESQTHYFEWQTGRRYRIFQWPPVSRAIINALHSEDNRKTIKIRGVIAALVLRVSRLDISRRANRLSGIFSPFSNCHYSPTFSLS